MNDYETMWEYLRAGIITEDEWRAFCGKRLEDALEENADVLLRLRDA